MTTPTSRVIDAYENAVIYKEKMKAFHDLHIRRQSFQVNDKV